MRGKGYVFYFGRDTAHSKYPNKISGDQKVEVYVLVLVGERNIRRQHITDILRYT